MAKDAKIHISLLKSWHREKAKDATLLKLQERNRIFIHTKDLLKNLSVCLMDPLNQTTEPPVGLVALTLIQLSMKLKQRKD